MTGLPGAVQLVALVVLLTGLYALSCLIWPYRNCRRCHGTGKRRAPLGHVYRLCPACDHTGIRPRTGRRLLNHTRRTRHPRKDHR
jgi:hypothetical protein